ncbi:MAG: mechanosensitive ion channel [Gammaproteobacteria bacterium]|nr:mechanosensitive ion channel [Gammaproteobacteria bacterium]
MDFSALGNSLTSTFAETIPNLLSAVVILIVGWLVAVVLRALVKKLLGLMKLNTWIENTIDDEVDAEGLVAGALFWIVLLMVLVAFFSVLNLGSVSAPLEALVTKVFDYAPNLIGGGAIALVAWIVASLVRTLTVKALAATTLDDKVATQAGMQPISANAGNVLYWLIILLFLPAILGALKLGGLLDPVQNMVDQILAMLPNIFAALVIGFVGWFVARILRDLVANLLAATGLDRLGDKVGLAEDIQLSNVAGLVVFIFVLVPALIGAINALQIEAISAPATQMLSTFMAAIPKIFAAMVILTVAYFLARFISGLVGNLLHGFGADEMPAKMGLEQLATGGFQISKLAGTVVSIFIFLFAAVEASNQLGFEQITDLVTTLIEFAGQILLGTTILIAGFWLASIAYRAIIRVSGPQAGAVAGLARIGILGLVLAMGLRAMGIADDIVNLAFMLVLGAVAVAGALSFGLGGREAAGRQLEYWLKKLRNEP